MRSGGQTPHYGSSTDMERVLDLTFGFATYVVAMVTGRCYYRATVLMRCLISFVTLEKVSLRNRLCTLKDDKIVFLRKENFQLHKTAALLLSP